MEIRPCILGMKEHLPSLFLGPRSERAAHPDETRAACWLRRTRRGLGAAQPGSRVALPAPDVPCHLLNGSLALVLLRSHFVSRHSLLRTDRYS